MQEIYSDSMARTSSRWSCCIAGMMALALGILGIYGVISYAVSQARARSDPHASARKE